MTRIRFACGFALGLCALASGSAAAHGGVHFGIGIGVPLFPPAYYYPPPYYYPPAYYPPAVVAAPAAQPVYVEQAPPQAAAPGEQSWYYCADSKTYYPYVKECHSPWQRVPARPPAS
jgi:hypothetical protein